MNNKVRDHWIVFEARLWREVSGEGGHEAHPPFSIKMAGGGEKIIFTSGFILNVNSLNGLLYSDQNNALDKKKKKSKIPEFTWPEWQMIHARKQ